MRYSLHQHKHISVPVGMLTAYNALFWSVYSSALWLCGSFNDVNTAFFTGIVMCHTLSGGKSLAEDECERKSQLSKTIVHEYSSFDKIM